MKILSNLSELRTFRQSISGTVGLVPTMGYLHDGHLSLVKTARKMCDVVIATIFVNPTQFAPTEDLSSYPRDLSRDLALLKSEGVDAVFTPSPEIMYPPRFQTHITVNDVSQGREGAQRPEHFQGVATVVAKLFNMTQPHKAFFGQKDAQQVVVIRQMVRDLNFPIDIVIVPVFRESDGLAMSSRNVYLNTDERQHATILYRTLQHVAQHYDTSEHHPEKLKQLAETFIQSETPHLKPDYISFADAGTLDELTQSIEKPVLVSLAVRVGKPRLLDNCLLPIALNTVEGATKTLGVG